MCANKLLVACVNFSLSLDLIELLKVESAMHAACIRDMPLKSFGEDLITKLTAVTMAESGTGN